MTNAEKVNELLNTQEIFTQEDYELCKSVDPESAKKYLFYHSWDNTWLNLNVYSEWSKEEHDLKIEQGL